MDWRDLSWFCRFSPGLCCLLSDSTPARSFTLPSDNSLDRTRRSWLLHNGIPTVPPRRTPSELDRLRRCLPVFDHQLEILQLIRDHQVVLVLGDTGSGKTTQVHCALMAMLID